MITTPSSNSSFFAGCGLWALFWATIFKIDSILGMFGIKMHLKDKILNWVNDNKAVTLMGTEAINFGVHGVSNPLSVTLALGGTISNIVVIFFILPIRKLIGLGRSQ